jgi:hypothetical protein
VVINGRWRDLALTISVKSNCLTISLASKTETEVFSFDLSGRLWTAMLKDISYRRGLDGKIVAKWAESQVQRSRKWLSKDDASRIQEYCRQKTALIYDDLISGQTQIDTILPEVSHLAFQKAISFDPERAQADESNYRNVYKPVGILPPDQYMAVVLQATEGCSFNTCTFCNFYRDRPFRIKSPSDFYNHTQKVKSFLGEGLSLRRTIFLGDANALVIPTQRLLPLLDIVHRVFDVESLGGIYAFLDGFSGEKKSEGDFSAFAKAGLKRIYIGMESGSPALLQFLKKPGKPADVLLAVRNIKACGISVGIIILLGAGGHQFEAEHVQDTIDLVNQMPLDLDDLIYFSELVENEGLEYVKDAFRNDLNPLSEKERQLQGVQIEQGLRFSVQRGTPHISRYDIREFVY